jgi:hypothetical protein
MKKSKEMMRAEARHCTEVADALNYAIGHLTPFTERGEGGWALRRLVKRAYALCRWFYSKASAIERELEAMEPPAAE